MSFSEQLRTIVDSRAFQRSVFALILLGAALAGLETSRSLMEGHGGLLRFLDRIVVALFVVEALMKMGAHGRQPWRYFRDPWNCFDFAIVVLCLIPNTGEFAVVGRLARILRTLRMIRVVPRLQMLVTSLLKGLPSVAYVGLLLLMLFYIYGVAGVFLFRDNDPFHFASLERSFLTLFGVVTLDNWDDVFYPQLFGTDVYPAPGAPVKGEEPVAQPAAAILYFISFVVMGTIIVMNLVVGVILTSIQEAQTERDREAIARARESEKGLTLADELTVLEHQLDDLRSHLHLVRARVEEGGDDGKQE